MPSLLLAQPGRARAIVVPAVIPVPALGGEHPFLSDTIKVLKATAKADGKVKEVTKAKKQPKPEKVDENPPKADEKPKRQRRPDGMERPPEIPRRNDN